MGMGVYLRRGHRMRNRDLENLLQRVREDPEVLAVMLFGSMARGEAGADSDVDVCLVLYPQARDRARAARLRYLDLADLDLRAFQSLPLYVRRRVLKEGQVLLCKDEDLLYEVAYRTVQAFEDFKPAYRLYLEAVERG